MATLQNVQGRSLVPDIGPALQDISSTIIASRQRTAQAEQEAEKQRRIDAQFKNLIPDPTADPTAQRSTEQKAFLILASIDPDLAQTAREIVERGDAQELEFLRQTAETGARQAALVSAQPDFASKQKAINILAADAQAQGKPLDRFIELSNMNEDRLDLELQKMTIAGKGLQDVLKTTEKFVPVVDKQGNVTAQKNLETGQIIPDPRAVTPTVPTTAIGKARQDLKAGLITQDDFNTIKSTPKKFQTDVGKLLEDQKLAIEMFGAGSEQAKAIDEALSSAKKGEPPKLSDVSGIRKEFTKLSGDFIKLRDAIGKVQGAADNPSAAGDLAMIFNFMKILDPGSTVREGEFATAQNSAGVPERLRAQYNQIISGERLTVNQRADFLGTANRMFEGQSEKQVQLENSFRAIAERQNMNPDDVVVDFMGTAPTEDILEPPAPAIIQFDAQGNIIE